MTENQLKSISFPKCFTVDLERNLVVCNKFCYDLEKSFK